LQSRTHFRLALALGTALAAGSAAAAPNSLNAEILSPQPRLSSIVNIRELAEKATTRPTGRSFAMPMHRLPQNAHHTPPLPARASNVAISSAASGKAGFIGIYEGVNAAAIGGDIEPPDQGLAVANNEVAEIVNLTFQVFTNKGVALMPAIDIGTMLNLPANSSYGDPHIEYDASTKRWFIDTYFVNGAFNGLILAVSETSDPMGSYYVYQVDAQTKGVKGCFNSCFGDYPQPGYDANAYYIAADLFSNVTGGFVSAAVYAFPKATLLKGATVTPQRFLEPEFVLEPSIPVVPNGYATEANGTEYLMTARQILDGTTDLAVYAITNTNAIATGGTLAAHSVTLPSEAYASTVPSTQPNQVGPYGQSVGATTAPQLDGGYNAFGNGVKYLNGTLIAALTSGSADTTGLARDIVAWFNVKPVATPTSVTATISAQGYVTPPNGYSISYPGIALNSSGNGIMGITVTNPNPAVPGGYPSAAYVRFSAGHPTNKFGISGQGGESDDGFTGYAPYGTVGRWGDFSSATVDPVTGIFYVGNEFIPNSAVYPRGPDANWGTFITEVK